MVIKKDLVEGRYSAGESRYNMFHTIVKNATKAYIDIARKYGLHPVSLAIAFVLKHPLVASAIFGATKLWQLQQVLDACKMELNPEIIANIDKFSRWSHQHIWCQMLIEALCVILGSFC
ncbi:protein tas-like isoform X2 [Camellia sinensis]|uniref:protein tas-like isoform X2 n=1 Tax=Camellia sinensis TaxID=4442 RepID=UPI001036B02E|nr:protein tas-like isoform X2 [Camellia sinensis]